MASAKITSHQGKPLQAAAANNPGFISDDPALRMLEPDLERARALIQGALDRRDLIMVRHHADTDGYCAGIALEEALVPLVQAMRDKVWQGYRRLPSKSPFYDYADCLRDLDTVSEALRMGKKPLLVLADIGSGEENMLSLRRMKQQGVQILIIDHHPFPAAVTGVVDVFVNPHMKGLGSDPCAGALCAELAYRFAPNLKQELTHLAALSSVTDHSKVNDYLHRQPLSLEMLHKLGICVDFEAHTLRFTEADSVKDLLFNKGEVVELLSQELEARTAVIREIARKYMQVRKVEFESGPASVMTLDLEKTMLQEYPGSKILGIAHGFVEGPHVSLGVDRDMVTFRADGVPVEFPKLMAHLMQAFPYAGISGGGHAAAGSIRFVPAAKEEILQEIRKYLKLS